MNKFNEDRKTRKHQSHLLKCNYDIVYAGKYGQPAHDEVSLTGGSGQTRLCSGPWKAVDLNTEEKLHLTVRNEVFPKVSLASNLVRSKACQEQ